MDAVRRSQITLRDLDFRVGDSLSTPFLLFPTTTLSYVVVHQLAYVLKSTVDNAARLSTTVSIRGKTVKSGTRFSFPSLQYVETIWASGTCAA